jgi:PST family polysaccharide transporter
MLALNAAAAVVAMAFAVPLAGLLGPPAEPAVLAAFAVPLVLSGLGSFYLAVLQRELRFAQSFACLTGQVAATAVVSVAMAAAGAGVWSLVGGQIAGAAAAAALSVALAPYRVAPRLRAAPGRELLRSARGFWLQGGTSFVEQNVDYFVVGSVLGSRPLGLYSMAYRIGELPYAGIVAPVGQATMPGFARMRHRGQDATEAAVASLELTAVCALPLGLLASATARPLVEALLGAKWEAAVPLLSILGLWGAARAVQGSIGWIVNALGHSWDIGRAYALLLAVSMPALVVAAHQGGTEAVAWVMVASMTAMTAILARIASRRAGIPLRRLWGAVRPALLASVPCWLAARAIADLAHDCPAVVALLAALAGGSAAYVAVVVLADRGLPARLGRQIRRATRAG